MNRQSRPRSDAGSSLEKGDGPAPFVDERDPQERILAGLAKLGGVLRAKAWEGAAPRGLNPTQAQILVLLLRVDRRGLSLSGLADQLGVSQPTASDSVAALDRKGLVAKKTRPEDGRRLSVTLTRKGRTTAQEIALWPNDLIACVDHLSEDQQATLLRLLAEVVRAMVVSGQVAPARTCLTCRFFVQDAHPDPVNPHHCAFADAPFGDLNLRVDCQDHEAASESG